MPKAVFAGCARSCAPFLDGVLANIEALGSTYDAYEVVIVENDSADDTRDRLRKFAQSRPNVRLIEADGLDQAHPRRGDRLAVARNIYRDAVREPRYADCDDLVVLDLDDVNLAPIDLEAFAAARRWLWQEPDRCGVFVNSVPFYYDIWALRHPQWCPEDCWKRVRAVQADIGLDEAVRRHVAELQIAIAPTAAPIFVDSAFGGLGIYRREAALIGTYVGLDPDGEETCDHVAFNADVKGSDGLLAIYPALQNQTAREHIIGALRGARTFNLEQDGASCALIGPAGHQLPIFRAAHPLFGRRFPALARIVSDHAPDALFIDVGAGIGDSIALARLAGAKMPAIAVESSLENCKFLWENIQRSPALFGDTRFVWGQVGADPAGQPSEDTARFVSVGESAPSVQLSALQDGTNASLVKADGAELDDIIQSGPGSLQEKQPILWFKAQTMSDADETRWRALFDSLADQWPRMILFDNFGFAIAAGNTADLASHAVGLMAYARRQREREGHKPSLYYLDIAFFPEHFAGAYEDFRLSLPELT